MKRSQQINIALTKLPPVNSLKQAILSMDNSVLEKESLEVRLLLFILVTERVLKGKEGQVFSNN